MTEKVSILVGGTNYSGWTECRINRSLETAASSFSFTGVKKSLENVNSIPIRPGTACEIKLGNTTMLRGFTDTVALSYAAESYTLAVSGRSQTGDLVDCTAAFKSSSWKNTKVEAIINQLCYPYNVSAYFEALDTGDALPKFVLTAGETVFEAIDRLCRLRGLVATDDHEGRLIITRAGSIDSDARLEHGKNILSASASYDASQRFSDYRVRGQRAGTDNDYGEAVNQASADAADDGITRYRNLWLQYDGQASAAACRARAIWESATRAGRSIAVTVTVAGWRQKENGEIWKPNRIVKIIDPVLNLNTRLLITGVEFTLNNSEAYTATLTLAPTIAYTLTEPQAAKHTNVGYWKELQ